MAELIYKQESEVKSVTELADGHPAQLFNCPKATGMRLGLLINFSSHPKVEYERIAL
jgi:GxxExxY protein